MVGSHQNAGLNPLEAVRFLQSSEGLADARLVSLAPPTVPVPEVAAAEDSWERNGSTSLGAGDAILAPVAALPYVPTTLDS